MHIGTNWPSLGKSAARGTLIVAVPTGAGIAVAADSRTTVDDEYFDGTEKLLWEPTSGFLVTITGCSKYYPSQPEGISNAECYRNGRAIIDSEELVRIVLQERAESEISNDLLQEVGARVSDAWNASVDEPSRRDIANAVGGGSIAQIIVLCHADSIGRIGTIQILADQAGRVYRGQSAIESFASNRGITCRAYGESDYLMAEVWRGPGLKPIAARLTELIGNRRQVGELDGRSGAIYAYALVEAAVKRHEINPAPTGIGGPINVGLLSERQWRILDIAFPQ